MQQGLGAAEGGRDGEHAQEAQRLQVVGHDGDGGVAEGGEAAGLAEAGHLAALEALGEEGVGEGRGWG